MAAAAPPLSDGEDESPLPQALSKDRLPIFDQLLASENLPAAEREIVRHHKGKSLLKIGRVAEALDTFKELAAEPGTHYATKLQIARLSDNAPNLAKSLIFEIIDAEYVRPGSVAMSVLLETLSTLRRNHLRQYVEEMTIKYGKFMAADQGGCLLRRRPADSCFCGRRS